MRRRRMDNLAAPRLEPKRGEIKMKPILASIIIVAMVFSVGSIVAATKPEKDGLPPNLDVNWDERHDIEFYGTLLNDLVDEYPKLAETYSIGRSWRERDLWCIELTSQKHKHKKTGIAIIGNIHGGERESGETAAYAAWWLATNYDDNAVAKKILDEYIIYVIPVMNPDGYVEGVRQNLRPTDHNDDGVQFSDPYFDTNEDGMIATVYIAPENEEPWNWSRTERNEHYLGMESPDFDRNDIPGDDPRRSDIDLNRTFNYMWNYWDAETKVGAKYMGRAGANPASEPEVQAVQHFLIHHPVYAVITGHTGIQCVLWPWCYNPEPTDDAEFMTEVGTAMAEKYTEVTGRNYYSMQSYDDYPTTAEMIDWTYGRLGIHSYTIEVYSSGTGEYDWGDTRPPYEWVFMGQWEKWDNVWFRNRPTVVPPEQGLMCHGLLETAIVMIESEPYGDGPQVPEYFTAYDYA